jgi:NTE family protein
MAKSGKKRLNLALQGGGAHGAYAWGILDGFLEDGRIEFDGICATSAGTLNAVALAHGLSYGGNDEARADLEKLWRKISELGAIYSPIRRMPWEPYMKTNLPYEEMASYSVFETFTNAFSPYQFNPLNINPLRQVIEETFDVNYVKSCKKVSLFITATDVYEGQAKVFVNKDIDIDVILASASLPFLFQAQMIKDSPYWDGGYTGNPALWPLFYNTNTNDLCVIYINPITRHEIPKTPYDITNRLNEITFNSSLIGELRAIAFVKKLIEDDMLKDKYKKMYKNIRLHAIRADKELKNYSVASKFETDWGFLTGLRDDGREAAKHWLKENFDAIGKKATVDIHDEFLEYPTK